MALIPIVILVATGCGAFYYWLSRRGLAAEERANRADRRRISLLTETVAYIGASLVLAGGGIAVGQAWGDFTNWGHVGIFAGTALLFLAVGVAVLWVDEPAIQRMIGIVWFLSAGCAGAAAGIAAHDVRGTSGAATALVTGIVIMLYSGVLWLIRHREMQLVATFVGLTITVSAVMIMIAGSAEPWLAFALGLWALGIGWVVVGWKYPQPLWTTVPLGTVIALAGPSFAVWEHGWVYAIGIATAAAAMFISVAARNTLLLAAGTLALFGYVTSAVVRYFHGSLGVPATLAISGVLLLAVAVTMARVRRGVIEAGDAGSELLEPEENEPGPYQPGQYEQPGQDEADRFAHAWFEHGRSGPAGPDGAGTQSAGTEPAGTEPAGSEPARTEPAKAETAAGGRAAERGRPVLHLPRAS